MLAGGKEHQDAQPRDWGHTLVTDNFENILKLFRRTRVMRIEEEIYPCEGGEVLAQAAQKSCGCCIPEVSKARLDWAWSIMV